MNIIKKDGCIVAYDFNKIRAAVSKSAARIGYTLSDQEWLMIEQLVQEQIASLQEISTVEMHAYVEQAVEKVVPAVAQAYRDYRNYKQSYVKMMTNVLKSADDLNYKIDRSNANTTSALISSQRSLIFTAFSKEYYKKFFLSVAELQAIEDGFIYIHDLGSRAQTYNCCLFDAGKVLQSGFEWEHIGYNEPKDVRTAGNLISDITLNCAAQQYGGFTIPEIDSILAPYAEKSFKRYMEEYAEIVADENTPDSWLNPAKQKQYALRKVTRDIEQVFQGFEHTFNTVASSRGDYPFVTMTGGVEESEMGQLVWKIALQVRREGQGKPGHKRPAIFPKLVFLYTEKLHGPNGKLRANYIEGVKTSAKSMYPDWLSLDKPDESIIQDAVVVPQQSNCANIFHKYHKFGVSRWILNDNNMVQENPEWVDSIVSPMGCRAYLSPIYRSGKLRPIDENDTPVFQGRFNGGAVSLNLPMIYREAQLTNQDYWQLLQHYMDLIDGIHIKTYEFLSKLKASCNPVAFCEGGFGTLKPTDTIKPLVDRITFSFGFTALNELSRLATGKSLWEERNNPDNIAYQTERYINDFVEKRKRDRDNGTCLYIAAIYATPAESLCGTQLEQFVKRFGVIPGVSDKAYFTNSFHMWVGEDITPWQKQDAEYNYFHTSAGGHIQYCRFANGDNLEYLSATITRAMKLGYYFGVNIEKSYCGKCGTEVDDGIEECPHCGSHDITTINRVCGYLGYSRVDGTTKMNDAKLAEIADRKSM